MNVVMDPDVQAVAEFMQSTLPANRLVDVAEAIPQLAVALWGHHERVAAPAIELRPEPISASPQPVASE